MNTFLQFKPPVIAHRGASGYAPENTLAAFVKAAQLGIKWVEFDVMLTACGTPVVFHDETLERTTSGQGDLNQYSMAYLQSLDAGGWFHSSFSGERIPSLIQVMQFLIDMQMHVNVELKPLPGEEMHLSEKVLDVLNNHLQNAKSQILFSSFSVEALIALREKANDALIGLLVHEWDVPWQTHCEELRCVSMHVNQEIMTVKEALEIKQKGLSLLCYTVNDRRRAKELFSWGVDAVFSDFPDKILNNL